MVVFQTYELYFKCYSGNKTISDPMCVILAPTRELIQQIFLEARRYSKTYGEGLIRTSAILGGMNKYDQIKELRAGQYGLIRGENLCFI